MNIVGSLSHAPIRFVNLTEIGGDLGLSRCSRQPQAPAGIPLLSDHSVYWLYGYGGLRAGNRTVHRCQTCSCSLYCGTPPREIEKASSPRALSVDLPLSFSLSLRTCHSPKSSGTELASPSLLTMQWDVCWCLHARLRPVDPSFHYLPFDTFLTFCPESFN